MTWGIELLGPKERLIKEYSLTDDIYTVGTKGDIRVPERFESVSPFHGIFSVKDDELWYKNLSLNGTGVKYPKSDEINFIMDVLSMFMFDENTILYLGPFKYLKSLKDGNQDNIIENCLKIRIKKI